MSYSVESCREWDGDFSGDDARTSIVGKEVSGSGAGLGIREIEWSFDRLSEARKVARKLKERFPGDSINVWHHECCCRLCGNKHIHCEEILLDRPGESGML